MISAKVICDSVNAQGNRLTTFELRYPKFIHGEFMTHRVFSRNASSSRAIPTERLIAEVRENDQRAGPVFWGKNQKGMQAVEELEGEDLRDAQWQWEMAAQSCASWAEAMVARGVHKQIVNRLLEPFSHINVVCTATEYMNFFGLRLDKAAQPEARTLAEEMWREYNESLTRDMNPGTWHLPYILAEEFQDQAEGDYPIEHLIKVSVARCARVSYKSFETGKTSTLAEDLVLYHRLMGAQPLHASPAEHQATPDEWVQVGGIGHEKWMGWKHKQEHGNFVGWRQHRKMLPGESCAPLPLQYIPQ